MRFEGEDNRAARTVLAARAVGRCAVAARLGEFRQSHAP
jgi:hypothetical protein